MSHETVLETSYIILPFCTLSTGRFDRSGRKNSLEISCRLSKMCQDLLYKFLKFRFYDDNSLLWHNLNFRLWNLSDNVELSDINSNCFDLYFDPVDYFSLITVGFSLRTVKDLTYGEIFVHSQDVLCFNLYYELLDYFTSDGCVFSLEVG